MVRCKLEMRPHFFRPVYSKEICMRGNSHDFARIVVLILLSIAGAISTAANGNPDDKAISSRTAEVDGVQLHYLTAGRRAGGGGLFVRDSGACRICGGT